MSRRIPPAWATTTAKPYPTLAEVTPQERAKVARAISARTPNNTITGLVDLLNGRRAGWPKGEERVRLVTNLWKEMGGDRSPASWADLIRCFGAGQFEVIEDSANRLETP